MVEAYIGEIRMFAGTYAPTDWAFCNGQLLSISGATSLFALIGNTYGGDGKTSFALPDLRGRVPIGYGTGPGLSPYPLGTRAGLETVQLSLDEMPVHRHSVQVSGNAAASNNPGGGLVAQPDGLNFYVDYDAENTQTLVSNTVGTAGSNVAHYNMMPSLAVSFIIALKGLYPQRP